MKTTFKSESTISITMEAIVLSPYWEDQRDPFLSKNKRWKELGHQMVLIKHNGNKPSALCFQKHEMQNFPNILRLIDSQRAHKYTFCDLLLEGLQVAILSTCKILVQPSKFRLYGAKQRLVFH